MTRSSSTASARPLPKALTPFGWIKRNLFSGPLNSVLTLLILAGLFLLLRQVGPWLIHSVWNAASLADCRAQVEAEAGIGATGACWAVIAERWHQYVFGFYPSDLYWRPTLAFALLFPALAPILFPHRAFRLFAFSLIYPALSFWLLWGGSLWSSVAAMLGFAVLAVVYIVTNRRFGSALATAAGFFAAILWWMIGQGVMASAVEAVLPITLQPVASDQMGGFLLALTIGVTSVALSLPIGILLALGRQSSLPLVRYLSIGFIECIRGLPLIALLFTASLLLQYFLPPRTTFDLVLRVIILVTLFSAAYIAEVIRGALAALPNGQGEAALALGLDYWQTQRLVILPQALKTSIPGIVSEFIGLFKDTTLVAFVGLFDPLQGITAVVRADAKWKGIYWEPYIFVGLIFFLLCFSMSRYSMYLERRLKTDHR